MKLECRISIRDDGPVKEGILIIRLIMNEGSYEYVTGSSFDKCFLWFLDIDRANITSDFSETKMDETGTRLLRAISRFVRNHGNPELPWNEFVSLCNARKSKHEIIDALEIQLIAYELGRDSDEV